MTRVCTFADGHTQHEAILDYAPATRSYRSPSTGACRSPTTAAASRCSPPGHARCWPLPKSSRELAMIDVEGFGGWCLNYRVPNRSRSPALRSIIPVGPVRWPSGCRGAPR
jgi:hypothetical protein